MRGPRLVAVFVLVASFAATSEVGVAAAAVPRPGVPIAAVGGGEHPRTGTASISGVVSVTVSGVVTPLVGACVSAQTSGGTPVEATTATGGTYTLSGLDVASYDVYFSPCGAGDYVAQYYSDAATTSAATPVVVSTSGQAVTGINATLAPGTTISGTVSTTSGPLAGVCASALSSGGPTLGSTPSTSAGAYTITGVPGGTYTIEFYGCAAGVNVVAQYYTGTASGTTLASSAAPLTVGSGPVTGIDATLVVGASIGGTVSASGGGALAGVCVSASVSGGPVLEATTDATGSYTITGLATGTYTVMFRSCSSATAGYVAQYYGDAATAAAATPVVVSTSGQAVTSIDATLVAGGTIAGTVEDATGTPVAGECVSVDSLAAGFGGTATTDATGAYSVPGLAAGSYVVEFTSCTSGGPYADQYYNGSPGGTPGYQDALAVTVVAGQTAPVDATLVAGGSITGTITAAAGGADLAGICVTATSSDGSATGSATTDAAGDYSIGGLVPTTYTVQATDCSGSGYATTIYSTGPNGGSLAGTPVTVTAGTPTPGIDIALAAGESLSGTVTAATGGADLPGICVDALTTSGPLAASAVTNASGAYTLSGLPAGSYLVEFIDCATSTYATAYYATSGIVSSPFSATAVAVTTSPVTGINAALVAGESLSGSVTAAAGGALAGICVDAWSPATGVGGATVTDASGAYTLGGLPSGSYIVSFAACSPGSQYVTAYYVINQAAGTVLYGDASLVDLSAGSASAIDIALGTGGGISGTITSAATGLPVAGVCANVSDAAYAATSAPSTTNGVYAILGLPAGSYSVYFAPCGTGADYAGQYYNGTAAGSLTGGVAVNVGPGATTPGIDASMVAGGAIAGTTTAGSPPTGVAEICVYAYGSGGLLAGTGFTATDGSYLITGLPAGSYVIQFSQCGVAAGPGYVQQYYTGQPGGASSYGAAGLVVVTAGATTTGIDASMVEGGAISGTVTAAAGGGAIAGICVTATSATGIWAGSTQSLSDGTYSLSGLTPGAYTVGFAECGNVASGPGYVAQYYDGVSGGTAGQADAVAAVVQAGATTSSIDAVMAPGGAITGTVTAPGGQGIEWICVSAVAPTGVNIAQTGALSAADGSYTLSGLPTGSYAIEFTECANGAAGYLSQYYDGSSGGTPDAYRASLVAVTAGATTTSPIDAVMALGGAITGTLSDAGGAPVAGLCVNAQGAGARAFATTDATGSYTLSGLATGSYTISWSDGCGAAAATGYVPGALASPVSVTAGASTSAPGGVVAPGGAITGTLSDATGAPVAGLCVNAQGAGAGAFATTDATGSYTLSGLATGSYTISWSDGCGAAAATGYAPGALASPVSVTAGAPTSAPGGVVAAGGEITGTLSDAASAPVAGLCVNAIVGGVSVATAVTDATGSYTLSGLSASSPVVEFAPCGAAGLTPGYLAQYYDGSPGGASSATNAQPVPVGVGQTVSSINAVMAAGGGVAGTVSDANGAPVVGLCVNVLSGGAVIASTTTDTLGAYGLSGLAPGSDTVSAGPCPGFPSGPSAGFVTQTTPVTVAAANVAPANISVAAAGAITGTVTDTTTAPVAGLCVFVDTSGTSPTYVANGVTAADGSYQVANLTPGAGYLVQFADCGNNPYAIAQYYDGASGGASTPATATPVSATAGQVTPSIDATITLGGAIAGTVTEPTGAPVAGLCVFVETPGFSPTYVANSATAADGTYVVGGLPATTSGDIVEFAPCGNGSDTFFVPAYYATGATTTNTTTNSTLATLIPVVASSTQGGVDAQVVQSQSVTITTSAPSSGASYTPIAAATSGLPVTITVDSSSSSVCSISSSGVVTAQTTGTCTLDANQAGNADYLAAAQFQQSFTVSSTTGGVLALARPAVGRSGRPGSAGSGVVAHTLSSQTITISSSPPAPATVGASYTPVATATSGLAVSLAIDPASTGGACTLSGGVVTFTGVGTCLLDASQAGDASYLAAPPVQQVITIGAGAQTITISSSPPSPATVGASYTPVATATSGLAVSFAIDPASTSGACTLSGGVVTFTGVGTCLLDASQAGDANYLAAPTASQVVSAVRGAQQVAFVTPPPAAPAIGQTYRPLASATSALPVTISVDPASTSGVCTLAGGVVTVTGLGSCVLDATQGGDAAWAPALEARQSFAVSAPVVVFVPPSTPPSSPPPSAPSVAPPPSVGGLPGSAFGTPTSAIAVAGAPTSVVVALGSSGTVVVTAGSGDLPAGASLAAYPVFAGALVAPAALGRLAGAAAISWQPAGSPAADLAVQITGPGIAVGDVVAELGATGWGALATVATAGAVTLALSAPGVLALVVPPAPALVLAAASGVVGRSLLLAASGGPAGATISYQVVAAGSAGCVVVGRLLDATRAGTCQVVARAAAAASTATSATVTFSFRALLARPVVTGVSGVAWRGRWSVVRILGHHFAGRPRVTGRDVTVRVVHDHGAVVVLEVRAAVAAPALVRLVLVFSPGVRRVVTVRVR